MPCCSRPFLSGSRTPPDPIDQYLMGEGFFRKHIARDASSLYRTISEQLFAAQNFHEYVRHECAKYIYSNKEKFISSMGPDDDFDKYLNDLSKPRTHGTLLELKAMAYLFKRNVLLFEEFNIGTWFVNEPDFYEYFQIFSTPDGHFDSVFTQDYIEDAAFCQSLVYEILYTHLFKLPDVRYAVERMLHDPVDYQLESILRYCTSSSPPSNEIIEYNHNNNNNMIGGSGGGGGNITTNNNNNCNNNNNYDNKYPDSIYLEDGREFKLDRPETTNCILENYLLCHFHNSEFEILSNSLRNEVWDYNDPNNNEDFMKIKKSLDSMLPEKYTSCVRQLLDVGITPFPYKVAKALDPDIYRNIEYDTWSEQRKEQRLKIWNQANILRIGSKCFVKIDEHNSYIGHIQEMSHNYGPCNVFVEGIGEYRWIPFSNITPFPLCKTMVLAKNWTSYEPNNNDNKIIEKHRNIYHHFTKNHTGNFNQNLKKCLEQQQQDCGGMIGCDNNGNKIRLNKRKFNSYGKSFAAGGFNEIFGYKYEFSHSTSISNFHPPPTEIVAMPFIGQHHNNNHHHHSSSTQNVVGNNQNNKRNGGGGGGGNNNKKILNDHKNDHHNNKHDKNNGSSVITTTTTIDADSTGGIGDLATSTSTAVSHTNDLYQHGIAGGNSGGVVAAANGRGTQYQYTGFNEWQQPPPNLTNNTSLENRTKMVYAAYSSSEHRNNHFIRMHSPNSSSNHGTTTGSGNISWHNSSHFYGGGGQNNLPPQHLQFDKDWNNNSGGTSSSALKSTLHGLQIKRRDLLEQQYPVNLNAKPSHNVHGADIPINNDMPTVRFFYNLGHEYFQQLQTRYTINALSQLTNFPTTQTPQNVTSGGGGGGGGGSVGGIGSSGGGGGGAVPINNNNSVDGFLPSLQTGNFHSGGNVFDMDNIKQETANLEKKEYSRRYSYRNNSSNRNNSRGGGNGNINGNTVEPKQQYRSQTINLNKNQINRNNNNHKITNSNGINKNSTTNSTTPTTTSTTSPPQSTVNTAPECSSSTSVSSNNTSNSSFSSNATKDGSIITTTTTNTLTSDGSLANEHQPIYQILKDSDNSQQHYLQHHHHHHQFDTMTDEQLAMSNTYLTYPIAAYPNDQMSQYVVAGPGLTGQPYHSPFMPIYSLDGGGGNISVSGSASGGCGGVTGVGSTVNNGNTAGGCFDAQPMYMPIPYGMYPAGSFPAYSTYPPSLAQSIGGTQLIQSPINGSGGSVGGNNGNGELATFDGTYFQAQPSFIYPSTSTHPIATYAPQGYWYSSQPGPTQMQPQPPPPPPGALLSVPIPVTSTPQISPQMSQQFAYIDNQTINMISTNDSPMSSDLNPVTKSNGTSAAATSASLS